MRRISLLVLGLMIGLVITGFFFSSVSRSGEQGDFFYSSLKNKDYEKIITFFDKDLLSVHPKDYWLQEFRKRSSKIGSLVSYKNTGFHTETIDGKSITRLDYVVVYSNGQLNERIDFVKIGSDYKIIAYEFSDENQGGLVSN